jgi:hypothetical protein
MSDLPRRQIRSMEAGAARTVRVGPGTPLVAPELRARAWCVVAGLALIVAVGGILVHGDQTPLSIEVRIQHDIDRHAGTATAWKPVFSPGIPLGIVAIGISLVVWSLARGWWRVAAAFASVPLAIVVAEVLLKPLVDRVSAGGDFMYPSGHLTGLGAAATLLLIVVGPRLSHSWATLVLGVACLLACAGWVLAAVASYSHGPLDTLAGLPTGAAVALAWVLVVDTVADAWAVPRGSPS